MYNKGAIVEKIELHSSTVDIKGKRNWSTDKTLYAVIGDNPYEQNRASSFTVEHGDGTDDCDNVIHEFDTLARAWHFYTRLREV